MIIDCIADLHGNYPKLEGGDLLIVAGDLTARDEAIDWCRFFSWLDLQKYNKKIFIGGNHDNFLKNIAPTKDPVEVGLPLNCTLDFEYLCDSGTEFEGLRIWGSPWTPWFKGVNPQCKAFMKSDNSLCKKWELIPPCDILITHGPAYGILDGVPLEDGSFYHCGSKSLYNWMKHGDRPAYHIFGHIHEAYGKEEHFPTYDQKMVQSINCSHVDGRYRPVNKPVRVVL